MLTKDLLRFKTVSGRVHPLFIAPDDRALLAFASTIVNTYRDSLRYPRSEIQESLAPLINSQRDLKLAKGILKLYDDLCEYSGDSEADYPAMRRTLFATASRMMDTLKSSDSWLDFRTDVFREAGETVVPLSENIYLDLPDYEQLVKLPDLTAEQLLEKYNIALAQSLVLFAESIDLTIEEPDSARMRRFFKYLKFFRLLADISKSSKWENAAPSVIRLKIDGPASILDAASKYGLQLASFLPAVFQLTKWKFTCDLKLRDKELRFSLDESCGLHQRFGRLGIYVPEEVKMFARLFAERCPDWTLTSESPFLKGKRGQTFVFPDITFIKGERKVYLELFHKWHSHQLAGRLDFLTVNAGIPLVLGVERQLLASNPQLKEQVESHPLFGERIFLFRDFPSIEKMKKILDREI